MKCTNLIRFAVGALSFLVSQAVTAQTADVGLVTDGAYFWILNGDGSRNWLSTAPSCVGSAKRIDPAVIPYGKKNSNVFISR